MVVARANIWALIGVALACGAAVAQETGVKATVNNTEVVQDQPFWLLIEISGEAIEMPVIPEGDAFVISSENPQRTHSFRIANGRRNHKLNLAYWSMALEPGTVTIPPVKAMVNGRMAESSPVTLKVTAAVDGESEPSKNVQVWTSETEVRVGKPFWIYVEASGTQISLPDALEVDGLSIDTRNSQRSSSFSFGREGQQTTQKRGFYAIALREGKIIIPSIEVEVSGRRVRSEPKTITARKSTIQTTPVAGATPEADAEDLTQDDLVFIEMDVDKKEAYQGEPILMTMQLWRIRYRKINSGPYRGGLIVNPTTEGFYVHNLDAESFETKRGPWDYEVTETRRLLYPTRSGDLHVGRWHWEGIALINRQSIVARDKLYYKLDAGPIGIKVKELPPAPGGFGGAVGQFAVESKLENAAPMQGVPTVLEVTVRGAGNPDAVGIGALPNMEWAYVSEPDRSHRIFTPPNEKLPQMAKYFRYTITPIAPGPATIARFDFVYFDPVVAQYVRKGIGPFHLEVEPAAEAPQHIVVPEGVVVEERSVLILAEDIHPLMPRRTSLGPHSESPLTVPLAVASPVLGYLLLSLIVIRRRRLVHDTGFARSIRAKTRGLKRLRGVVTAEEPSDALYRAVAHFVADKLDMPESGLTSDDVRRELERRHMEPDLRDTTVKILRACERARYASQDLSADEISALISGAEACMEELDRALKRGKK